MVHIQKAALSHPSTLILAFCLQKYFKYDYFYDSGTLMAFSTNKLMICSFSITCSTVEARTKDHALMRTWRLQFLFLNPLNRNPKEAETGNGSI